MESANAKRSALLIIDMQVGLLHGPEKPFEAERVVENINCLIQKARAASVPVLAVRHTGPQGSPIEAASALWHLAPELASDSEQDFIFDKTRPNCFVGTELQARLQREGVDELIVVGMKTQYCVDTTCRAAADLGFKVVLVADAHTCMDTPVLPAKSIIEHHNATLNGAFAQVLNTAEVSFQAPWYTL